MGLEIEKHLKKMVHDLKRKKLYLEEKMKGISGLRICHSQHRQDIMNLLHEESSHLKSTVNVIEENIRELSITGSRNQLSPRKVQESDCRDVHINPEAGPDITTKENVCDLRKASTSGTGDASDALAQALHEKVATLLLLSQEEERYLLENNVNAALQKKLEDLHRNLMQVTNEKVVALMELAQLNQEHRLLQEKFEEHVKQGKHSSDVGEKTNDKDGRLKNLLKMSYFKHWVNPLDSHVPHHEHAKQSGNKTMDFARMKIEYAALKESLESMEHLTSSVHRLRLSLIKVKESSPDDDTTIRKSETIENVVREAKLLKTALESCLPVSWSGEGFDEETSVAKVDCVSAAGLEMVELLMLASHVLTPTIS